MVWLALKADLMYSTCMRLKALNMHQCKQTLPVYARSFVGLREDNVAELVCFCSYKLTRGVATHAMLCVHATSL